MAKRVRIDDQGSDGGLYFVSDKKGLDFISSGCTILDQILGGGYPLGRMTNIIGDKSTAKTALATEAVINFLLKYPKGKAHYCEAESAFDADYAAAMGMPIKKVDFGDKEDPVMTIEDLYDDIGSFLDQGIKNKTPGIYIVDSFDGLTDEASTKLDIRDGSYNMTKQKQTHKLFRDMNKKLEKSRVNLSIVSQVRENINPGFRGEKQRRSGGKSLDFYASQFLWLAHKERIMSRQRKGIKRPIGIRIAAQVKKNKVGLPFRTCEFDFIFGFGICDIRSSLNYLKEVKRLGDVDLTDQKFNKYINEIDDMDYDEYEEERAEIAAVVKEVYREVETTFLPKRRKYQ